MCSAYTTHQPVSASQQEIRLYRIRHLSTLCQDVTVASFILQLNYNRVNAAVEKTAKMIQAQRVLKKKALGEMANWQRPDAPGVD